jgi:hypothetical protein
MRGRGDARAEEMTAEMGAAEGKIRPSAKRSSGLRTPKRHDYTTASYGVAARAPYACQPRRRPCRCVETARCVGSCARNVAPGNAFVCGARVQHFHPAMNFMVMPSIPRPSMSRTPLQSDRKPPTSSQ